jgi:oligopeptide/dipeptide ABC transporter ATP-binding protein
MNPGREPPKQRFCPAAFTQNDIFPGIAEGDEVCACCREQLSRFLRRKNIREYSDRLIEQFDVRSGQGSITPARAMSGGNQQKAIIAREIDKQPEILVAVQPTRGLDVGAIEYIHKQLVAQRDAGKAVLLISLELDEVMDVPDRILVMYAGEIIESGEKRQIFYQHQHPYTEGLLNSIPKVDGDEKKALSPIEGNPPEMFMIGNECAFARRCKAAMRLCAKEHPALLETEEGHEVRCFLPLISGGKT